MTAEQLPGVSSLFLLVSEKYAIRLVVNLRRRNVSLVLCPLAHLTAVPTSRFAHLHVRCGPSCSARSPVSDMGREKSIFYFFTSFGAASQRAARSSILFFAKRSLSWAGLLANARLKLERSVFVGPTWAAAARRREEGARADDQSRARCREGAEHHRGWARSHAPAQRSQAGVSGG